VSLSLNILAKKKKYTRAPKRRTEQSTRAFDYHFITNNTSLKNIEKDKKVFVGL